MRNFLNLLLDILFPRKCCICKKDLYIKKICEKCFIKIHSNKTEQLLILKPIMNTHYNKIFCPLYYQDNVKELIYSFKYKRKKYLINIFELIITQHKDFSDFKISNFDIIVPVPLHKSKYHQRGYNQSEILANLLKKHINGLVCKNSIIRSKNTKPLFNLTKKQRIAELRGAFNVIRPENFIGKNILLVDDIITTGSTINECAQTLKKVGTKSINVFSLSFGTDYSY